jgi:hypothetical protein
MKKKELCADKKFAVYLIDKDNPKSAKKAMS